MIELIVPAVYSDPDIRVVPLRVAEIVDDSIGYSRMIGQLVLRCPKRNDLAGRGEAVPKNKTGNDDMRSGETEVRLAGYDYAPRLLRGQFDGFVRQALCFEFEFDVGPRAVCKNDLVARLQRLHGAVELRDGPNEFAVAILRTRRRYESQYKCNERQSRVRSHGSYSQVLGD